MNALAVISGPGCSETAEPIAGVSKHFNMVIISYSAEALNLANRAMYPLFFRTIPHILQNGLVTYFVLILILLCYCHYKAISNVLEVLLVHNK